MSDHSDSQHTPSGTYGNIIKKVGYTLIMRIPEDRLECRCSYLPNDSGSMISRDDMLEFMKQSRVKEGVDETALDDFIVNAAAGTQMTDVLLAAGTPAVTGKDAYIALKAADKEEPEVEESSEVDLYQVQTFINLSEGDEIGQIIPEEPGIRGKNIMGIPIPAQPGKPLNIKIGKNIRLGDDGATLISEATGRLLQTSGEISVEELYVVPGDVNFKIGRINFKGAVEVRGDVLDNFDVNAVKGLRVTGNIGVCDISSEGDVSFCGMDGQDKGKIVCGGTLRAQFIHDTNVECVGDVIVEVELHNCTIRTLGRIIVTKGAISGGTYIALGGIESKKIGSPASVLTKLSAGMDYHDVEELETLMADLAENHAKAAESQELSEITALREVRAALTDRIMVIRSKTDDVSNAKINAKTAIYDKVILSIGTVTEEIYEQKDGPLTLIENTIEGGLRYLPMTGLNVKATDIEIAFVREQKKGSTFQ